MCTIPWTAHWFLSPESRSVASISLAKFSQSVRNKCPGTFKFNMKSIHFMVFALNRLEIVMIKRLISVSLYFTKITV